MGKKAKSKQGQTAVQQSNGLLHSEPPTPKAPKPGFTPGKTVLTSDVVTGEPLRADTPKYRVSYVRVDWQPTPTQREDGWQNDTSDVPQAVSSAKVEHLSALGGRAWTPGFRRYIGDAKPTTVEQSDAMLRDWWRSQYGNERVMRKLVSERGTERGRAAFLAARMVREYAHPIEQVAAAVQHSPTWVMHAVQAADRLAR